jgi:4'-phosphopantetheinyl transferase EntD
VAVHLSTGGNRLARNDCAIERSTAATVIFSAKEAYYKCQYSLTRRWLDFQDVLIDMTGDTFRITSYASGLHSVAPSVNSAHGRFLRAEDLIVAGIAVHAELE